MSPRIPVPQLAEWESNLATYGAAVAEALENWDAFGEVVSTARDLVAGQSGAHDPLRVFVEAASYATSRGLPSTMFVRGRAAAKAFYRDEYLRSFSNYSAVPPLRIRTRGLLLSFLGDGDTATKATILGLARDSRYSAETVDEAQLGSSSALRAGEVAAALQARIDQYILDDVLPPRTRSLLSYALGHIEQWFREGSVPVRAGDVAAICSALISYYEDIEQDRGIFEAIQFACDELWIDLWDPVDRAFRVDSVPDPTYNLAIAPIYSWLYYRTATLEYREKHDQIFASGVTKTSYGPEPAQWATVLGAVFNLNYHRGFDGIRWAQAVPAGNESLDDSLNPEAPTLNPFSDKPMPLYLPIKRETWRDHFESNGWRNIKGAIDAGYSIYAQPTEMGATAIFGIDLGVVVEEPTAVTLSLNASNHVGEVSFTPLIMTSLDGNSYSAVEAWTTRASAFRYLKAQISGSSDDRKSIAVVRDVGIRLAVKEKTESGTATALASDEDGTSVVFSKRFLDITSINVTPKMQSGIEILAYYDFEDVPNPTEFRVFLVRRSDGARVGGQFSWLVRGL